MSFIPVTKIKRGVLVRKPKAKPKYKLDDKGAIPLNIWYKQRFSAWN